MQLVLLLECIPIFSAIRVCGTGARTVIVESIWIWGFMVELLKRIFFLIEINPEIVYHFLLK